MSSYGKPIAAVVGAILMALYAALSDDTVTVVERILIGQAAISAVGVWFVPLVRDVKWGRAAKTGVGALFAVTEAMVLVIPGGLTGHEWIGLLIVLGTAAGVMAAPAVSDNGVASRGAA